MAEENSALATSPTTQTKEQTANVKKPPEWIRNAPRIDRPNIDRRYKPEKDGALDGVLVWRGQEEHRLSGDIYNAYAIRQADTNTIIGISERAGLRDLRRVKLNSKVFIEPMGEKELENGRKMQQFAIHAEHLEPLGEPTRAKPKESENPPDGTPAGSEEVPF
jgi:hypothetical protein